MPTTEIDHPILSYFLCAVESRTGMPFVPVDTPANQSSNDEKSGEKPKALPKGVVLGPDGKPCRTCTSVSSWMAMTKQHDTKQAKAPARSTAIAKPANDCPADVEQLGNSSWTFLHTLAASYPERPSLTQQADARQFMGLFGKMYPCWVCADDFRAWMKDGNEPRVSSRDEFGRWLCEAHNAVNVKLGKQSFDCNKWEERWRTGWKDGRCD